ncbi:MAG: hypothetical protein ABEI31_08040 [Halodesulfurarchaeum sp.]
MWGSRSRSPGLKLLGVLAAVVGAVGFLVFGWRFGGGSGDLPFLLGVGAAILALGWSVYRRR